VILNNLQSPLYELRSILLLGKEKPNSSHCLDHPRCRAAGLGLQYHYNSKLAPFSVVVALVISALAADSSQPLSVGIPANHRPYKIDLSRVACKLPLE